MFNPCKPAGAIEKCAGEAYLEHKPAHGGWQSLSFPTSTKWPRSTRASESTSTDPARMNGWLRRSFFDRPLCRSKHGAGRPGDPCRRAALIARYLGVGPHDEKIRRRAVNPSQQV